MQVLKFGGTSIATATNISRVLDIVGSAARKDRVILVCSAISGCTDSLLLVRDGVIHYKDRIIELEERHHEIITRLFTGDQRKEALEECDRIFDQIKQRPPVTEAFGEILSTRIIARKLACDGMEVQWLDSRKIIVKDDLKATYSNIVSAIEKKRAVRVFVAPGFIAGDMEGNVTTLGRGGSDYSAALYAAGAGADTLQIWTDVPGIMTTNPKDLPQAYTIPHISYKSAWRMAEHGAKVLFPPTVEPAQQAGIKISILNTFDPGNSGTIVDDYPGEKGWIGLARKEDYIYLITAGDVDKDSVRSRINGVLDRSCILWDDIRFQDGIISIKVEQDRQKEALKGLHKEFFELEPNRTRRIFIAGYGAVGKSLVKMIGDTSRIVQHNSGKTLRIAGVSDSRHFVIRPGGLMPWEVDDALASGSDATGDAFCKAIIGMEPKQAVFVDCTDSETIYRQYEALLEAGISVVSSNRRSLAVPYEQYARMKTAALHSGCFLRYETTVGAALPFLESIAMSANSSDEILSIEAVVSCTLNYLFSSKDSFIDTLRKAQSVGLTEKDPRTDLGGRDAMRKLIILAREAGVHLEEKDVQIEPVLDKSFFEGSVEDFYAELEKADLHFGRNQRFVASLVKDPSSPLGYKASIRVQTMDESHPAYWLHGTDNAIIVRSAFHPSPLVIQGAGEGAKVAASSILNDILK
ncbi:MAG: aspartate kinase [Bacteroidales bacterium]|nr:aspartate kinase [Bacteroidales bacterium]